MGKSEEYIVKKLSGPVLVSQSGDDDCWQMMFISIGKTTPGRNKALISRPQNGFIFCVRKSLVF